MENTSPSPPPPSCGGVHALGVPMLGRLCQQGNVHIICENFKITIQCFLVEKENVGKASSRLKVRVTAYSQLIHEMLCSDRNLCATGIWIVTQLTGAAIYCPSPSDLRNYWAYLQNSNDVGEPWQICGRKSSFKIQKFACDVTSRVKQCSTI